MRLAAIAALLLAGLSLSGCVVYDVASTTVGAATSVAGAAVDVATAPVDIIAGGSSDDKKK